MNKVNSTFYVSNFIPDNDQQKIYKKNIIHFLHQSNNIFTRDNPFGHFTVSAMIINHDKTSFLLCYHSRYQEWTPVGGHLDENNNIIEAAYREIGEEVGIQKKYLIIDLVNPIIALHQNKYLCRTQHIMHYDACILAILNQPNIPIIENEEVEKYRWISLQNREYLNMDLPSYTINYCIALEKKLHIL